MYVLSPLSSTESLKLIFVIADGVPLIVPLTDTLACDATF